MENSHTVGVLSKSQKELEGVDEKFLNEGLLKAREKTIEVVNIIHGEIREGQSEKEAHALALKIFSDFGVSKHWHRPYVRFGEGTLLTFHNPISENVLKNGDALYFDVGPVWPASALGINSSLEYEGDHGDTFILGQNLDAQKMIDLVHKVFIDAKSQWNSETVTGADLYKMMKAAAEEEGYGFYDNVEGHRISDFPHRKYASGASLSQMHFKPSPTLWVLEAMIKHPTLKMGAFYEDLLF